MNPSSEQNFNYIEFKVGNDKENGIINISDVNEEYLYMKENEIHFINSYIVEKFGDDIFIGLITNYNNGFGQVEYNGGDKEDFDIIEGKFNGLYQFLRFQEV